MKKNFIKQHTLIKSNDAFFHLKLLDLIEMVQKPNSPFTKIILSSVILENIKELEMVDIKNKTIDSIPYVVNNNIFGMYIA